MTRDRSTPGAAQGRPGVCRVMTIACAIALTSVPGCGGDASSMLPGGGGGGGPPLDAARVPDAVVSPPGDGPPASGGIASNTPGATVIDAGTPATPTLALLSSNLLQDPSASQVFQQWLGEVQNNGSALICLLSVDVSFQRGDGSELASFTSFASADPYMLDSLVTMPCLQPGQIGSFYSNGFAATAIALSDVARIAVRFSPNEFAGSVPAPHAPAVTSQVAPVFDGFGVTGSLRGQLGPIYNIGLDIYPRDAGGLVLGQLFAVDLDTLQPGATFPFTTLSVAADFAQYRQFADFIDGPAPAVRGPAARPASALGAAAAALDAVRRAQRAEIQARARTARGG